MNLNKSKILRTHLINISKHKQIIDIILQKYFFSIWMNERINNISSSLIIKEIFILIY